MTDITFTPEQIREIRRRIEALECFTATDLDRTRVVMCIYGVAAIRRSDALAAFPLPKVTRYRTFTRSGDTYRVRDGLVEFAVVGSKVEEWRLSGYGRGTVAEFAEHMARFGDWKALAALVGICGRPTEEVDA